ncbi:MAG: TIGR02270 family protein [Proteobacteria bacterium]|nr:TIGR02270 family protein [Pseudomonadota bacterium]
MAATPSRSIAIVVQQHASEAAHLRQVRSVLIAAPHVKLLQLRRLDDRIAAHLDGLAVAGEFGSRLCDAALESPGTGEFFFAAVRALDVRKVDSLDKALALAAALPEALTGLVSAFGWVSATDLKGVVTSLLTSPDLFRQRIGITACALHRVDPGPILAGAIVSPEPALRARALRCAGEVGRADLLPALASALKDGDMECRFRAAQSAVLLGDRGVALTVLRETALRPGPFRLGALALTLFAADPASASELMRQVASQREDVRLLIRAVGFAWDAERIPWLIGLMSDDKLARLAGESFSFITGLDLAWLDLERKPPEHFESGPNDNPEDEDVSMDEDDGLPWPDQAKVHAWWVANSQRFQPGVRYFMGAPPSWAHCLQVLKDGYQRQRIAAAQYLCLLRPGTPLFNCAAPAWRQKRLLERMN